MNYNVTTSNDKRSRPCDNLRAPHDKRSTTQCKMRDAGINVILSSEGVTEIHDLRTLLDAARRESSDQRIGYEYNVTKTSKSIRNRGYNLTESNDKQKESSCLVMEAHDNVRMRNGMHPKS